MTRNDSKSYLGYLKKLVDEYNNNYNCSTGKKSIHADCYTLTEKFESSHKAPESKVGDRVRISKYKKNMLSKGYTKNWSKEILVIASVLQTNPWMYKIKDLNGENPWTYAIKDLNGEKIIGRFHEKKSLLSKL